MGKHPPLRREGHLSELVNLRAVQKPISDARTATYVILSTGSGPGRRRFKSFRPDHSFLLFNACTARILSSGVFQITWSTPGVFLPVFSVTRRTARTLLL